MRTEVIEADGWKIEVRGRTRRTSALESEYLLVLKDAHPDMKALPASGGKAEQSPHGWSLAGVAASFRTLAARIHTAEMPDSEMFMDEPFLGQELVEMFESYLDCEQLPDRSDLWSRVEDAIAKLDKRAEMADPNEGGNTQKK